ncbi:MAG: isoprenylcysteine carboxylmethyltransferase family protein [Coriobacteriia bacterium]|nr:isoprenylcysteine carboxylmethyltransferase family protein [Coriobacteriia bacterium]MCL2870989.1 isoprenylcysteine carboxylmethyltransferase family protein [Coriobacteriia bacterium]
MLLEKICLTLGLALIGSVLVNSVILSRGGTRAIVFGETDKTDFLLIPLMATFVYLLLAQTFNLPAPAFLVARLWGVGALEEGVPTTGRLGIGFCAFAVVGLIATLISFGSSFRIGIDERHPSKLVTTGIFALSRNPIYVCFGIFLIGLTLVFASPFIIVVHTLLLLLFHRQVLKEEQFLKDEYGSAFEEYRQRVPRYL